MMGVFQRSISAGCVIPMRDFRDMDLVGFSSVGTQTPTEDRVFEFPESFSPTSSSPSMSSIGIQTDPMRRIMMQMPGDGNARRPAPKLFRRHSTGSDVYNFSSSSSPTLLTAIGGTPIGTRGFFSRRLFAESQLRDSRSQSIMEGSVPETAEVVGQQLRQIADDWDRGVVRGRSLSVSHFFKSYRRRTSSSSSSSS